MAISIRSTLPVDGATVNSSETVLSASFVKNFTDNFSTGTLTDTSVQGSSLVLAYETALINSLDVLWGTGRTTGTAALDAYFSDPSIRNANTISTEINWLSNSALKPAYLPVDYYTWQAKGYLYIPVTGDYTFGINVDDEGELYIDDVLVKRVSSWTSTVQASAVISYTEGFHKIKIRMSEGSGGDGIGLYWKKPGDTAFIVVPPTNFSNELPVYRLSGNRISNAISLSGVASSTYIYLDTLQLIGTSVVLKCAVTTDGVNQPQEAEYTVKNNGDLLVNDGEVLDLKFLWIKLELSTTDTTVTPRVGKLEIDIPTTDTGTMYFEIDITTAFDSPLKQSVTYVSVPQNSMQQWYPVSLVNNKYFWRVKTTANTEDYGWTMSVVNVIGAPIKRVLYQYENIAKYGPEWINKRALYQYENTAKYGPDWANKRALYQYENITDDPPFPWIERLSTTRVPEGGLVTIYGAGFGYKYQSDVANEDRFLRGYGGFVKLGTTNCNIVSWSWSEIVFQVPQGASSSGVKVELTAPEPTRESNVIGLEVYMVASDSVGIEFFVCDRINPNTVVAQLDAAQDKAFQVLLNNPGSGQFNISRYDMKGANRSLIKDQNFILCRLDGIDVFKWIIEARTPNYITSAENQMIGVSGRGVLAMLEWSVVYPTDLANPELTRHFEGTAAKIINDLIWEAQNRGGLVGMTDDWTTVADSVGNPWDDYQSIDFKVGTPLLQVINKFSEGLGVFDVEMTPNLVLRLFKNKGVDMHEEVVYRPGQAIVEHRNKSDATKVVNTVLVEGKDGKLAQATHPTSQLDWGRREGYLQATNVTDGLSEYGQRFLERAAFSDWGIQGKVVEFVDERDNKIKPFETYFVGDWITWTIPPEGVDEDGFIGTLRVKGVTCEEDPETGLVHYTLELNNIIVEYDIKLSQSIARLTNYSESDPLSTPNQTIPAPINHTHDHSLLTNLTYDSHPQYYNAVRHTNDQHENVVRVRGIKTEGENSLTGEVLFKAGANVSLVQDTEGKTIIINAVKDGGEIVYDTVLKSVGKETKTSDTSAAFIYHEGILHIYRQIKVESVKWYIRQAGTYDLEVINPDDGSVLKSVINKEVLGGQQEVFTFSIPFELRAGRYTFRITRQEGATTWSDARTGQPFHYNAFSIVAGYYNGNATMYCPPIVLDFYDSVF